MGILSQDLDKTAQRFVREAVYGIMASQSVMLTEIGRQLESRVSLKKIEERFSRQLIKSRIWDCIHNRILSLASNRFNDRTLLVLDLSDVKKKYAEKMEYLARVHDGNAFSCVLFRSCGFRSEPEAIDHDRAHSEKCKEGIWDP